MNESNIRKKLLPIDDLMFNYREQSKETNCSNPESEYCNFIAAALSLYDISC